MYKCYALCTINVSVINIVQRVYWELTSAYNIKDKITKY